jgi:hypothetical protein
VVGGRGLVAGIEPDRLGIILQRAGAVTLLEPCRTAVVVGALKRRIQFQCRIVIGNRPIEILHGLIGVAAVGEEFRLGSDLDRFVVVGDRQRVVAVAGEVKPAIVEVFRP